MRIGVDALYCREGKVGGMETYLRGVLHGLGLVDRNNTYRVYLGRPAVRLVPSGENIKIIECPIDTKSKARRVLWEQSKLPDVLERDRIELLWVPSSVMPLGSNIPTVITVPDLQHYFYPEHQELSRVGYMAAMLPLSCARARAIIAISDFTAATIERILGVDKRKITVVHCGVDHTFCDGQYDPDVRMKYGLPERFLFYPASTQPHKNHHVLLEAFRRLRQDGFSSLGLVLTGVEGNAHKSVLDRIVELGLSTSVKWLGPIARADVPNLYRAADTVVFPSRFEGFGLPPLEALAAGRPVVTANAASLPEVVGDAALTVAPDDVNGWVTALTRILTDEQLRKALAARGPVQAKRFSWTRAAHEMLRVFEAACV